MKKVYLQSFLIGLATGLALIVAALFVPAFDGLLSMISGNVEQFIPTGLNSPFLSISIVAIVILIPIFAIYICTPIFQRHLGLKIENVNSILIAFLFFCIGPLLLYAFLLSLLLGTFHPEIG